MEQLSTRIGIEPGPGLVGRFGDTVILIPRREAATGASAGTAEELLGLAAEVGSDRQAPASAIASRLGAWVIGHMSGDAPAFGIVAPIRDGVVMFLRGAVWCTITEGGSTREVSGEQALTWVDLIVPGTFQRLAIGGVAGLAGTGGSAVRPEGRGGARAGLRAEPHRGYPRAGTGPGRVRCGLGCGRRRPWLRPWLRLQVRLRLRRFRVATVGGDARAGGGPAGGGLGAPGRGPEPPADDGRADR